MQISSSPVRVSRRAALLHRMLAASSMLVLFGFAGLAQADSHLNQQPDDHVILTFWAFGPGGFCKVGGDSGDESLYMQRIMPNGTAAPFSIPKGKRLVVTDFNLKTYVDSPFPRTGTVTAHLRLINNADSPLSGHIVYNQDFHLVTDHDTNNLTIEGQTLAGISVGEDAHLCPVMSLDHGAAGPESIMVVSGNYRGYLIDAAPTTDPTGGEVDGDGNSTLTLTTATTTRTLSSTKDLYSTLR